MSSTSRRRAKPPRAARAARSARNVKPSTQQPSTQQPSTQQPFTLGTQPSAPDDEPSGSSAEPSDQPLPTWLAAFSVVLFTAIAVLSAIIEVVLVPVRIGTTVVPVSVALALIGNFVIPVLSRRAVPITTSAVLPALAWVATVLYLSQARPEGDVLLVGTAPLVYVTYALLGVGIVTAMVTVVRGQAHAIGAGSRGL